MNIVNLKAETLDETAAEINRRFGTAQNEQQKAEDYGEKARYSRIYAGQLLLAARQRVESGTETNMSWSQWCRKNIDRSMADIRKVMKIAGSRDPEEAADREKEDTKTRMKKNREEKEDARADDVRASFSQTNQCRVEATMSLVRAMTPDELARFDEAYRRDYHGYQISVAS